MKALNLILFLSLLIKLNAQPLLEITYSREGNKFISLSDSNSQFYYMANALNGNAVKKMEKKKLVHHSTIAQQDSAAYWEEVNYPAKIELLIKSDFESKNWIIYPNIKKILGYTCQLAMQVDAKKDTTLVWYTDSLGNYFAKCYAFSAPGVVLEMQQQINSRGILLKYNAVKINFKKGKIVFPNATPVLTEENWIKYRKGNNKLSELNTNPEAIIPRKGDIRYKLQN